MFRSGAILLDYCERSIGIDVTSARTVMQLASGIFDIRVLRFLVRARLVFARMATGTIWLECRELPVNDIRVALMTIGACQVVSVVLRLVRQARVAVVSGSPRVRIVASPAIYGRIEVPRVLPRCKRAVMAR